MLIAGSVTWEHVLFLWCQNQKNLCKTKPSSKTLYLGLHDNQDEIKTCLCSLHFIAYFVSAIIPTGIFWKTFKPVWNFM